MLKIVKTEFEIMVLDEQDRVFLVLKNPYNNSNREVTWQLPSKEVSGDLTMTDAATKMISDEYNFSIENPTAFCSCDSMHDLYYLISIGLVSEDNLVNQIEIKDIKENIAYKFCDLDDLPQSLSETSRMIINKYKNRKKY